MSRQRVATQSAPAGGRIGLVLMVLGVVAGMALLAMRDEPPVLAVEPVRVEPPLARAPFAPDPPRGAVALVSPEPQPAAAVIAKAPPSPSRSPPPVPIDFRFLGSTGDGGETSLLLYGGGRTLAVRGTGPIDDEYVVDAIQDGRVVLRFVPAGTTQVLELKPGQPPRIPPWSAADSAQD